MSRLSQTEVKQLSETFYSTLKNLGKSTTKAVLPKTYSIYSDIKRAAEGETNDDTFKKQALKRQLKNKERIKQVKSVKRDKRAGIWVVDTYSGILYYKEADGQFQRIDTPEDTPENTPEDTEDITRSPSNSQADIIKKSTPSNIIPINKYSKESDYKENGRSKRI